MGIIGSYIGRFYALFISLLISGSQLCFLSSMGQSPGLKYRQGSQHFSHTGFGDFCSMLLLFCFYHCSVV